MKLKIHTYTNIGGQKKNEDYLEYYCDYKKSIFVLADGLGSHGNGEIASSLITQSILSELKELQVIEQAELEAAFYKANLTLDKKRKESEQTGMLTTAVALAICENRAVWGHVGDSRLYFIADNELEGVTRDHSVTYKKYLSGDISYHDINTDEDRSSLLNTFGNAERYHPEFIDIPQVIKEGDAFLLCSDGFWECVYDEEILIDFLKSDTPEQWVNYMLLRHIKRTKPVNDSYSLLAVFVE